MASRLSTSLVCASAGSSKASQSVSLSFAYHQGGAACSASRRLRHVRVDPAQINRASLTSLSARTPHGVHVLHGGVHWRASALDGSSSPFSSTCGFRSANSFAAQAFRDQHPKQRAVAVFVHLSVPSSSVRLLCSQHASRRGQRRGHFTRLLELPNQELGTSIQAGGCND